MDFVASIIYFALSFAGVVKPAIREFVSRLQGAAMIAIHWETVCIIFYDYISKLYMSLVSMHHQSSICALLILVNREVTKATQGLNAHPAWA